MLRVRLSALVLAALATVLALAFAGVARAANGAPAVGALRIGSTAMSSPGDLSRYQYVILNAWDHARIGALKAANPRIKVLLYKNMIATRTDSCRNGADDALISTGVGFCAAEAGHPEWFLSDTAGRRIEFCDYPGVWMMDMGAPAYQSTWLANVSSELKTRGWDGVFVDDTNPYQKYHLCGRTIARYPSEADQAAATRSFLARVGPSLQNEGFLVVPNIPSTTMAIWKDWLQFTSGVMQEYFTKWGEGPGEHFAGSDWTYRQSFYEAAQDAGKVFLGLTYAPGDDVRSMRYARASLLIDWDGGPAALLYEPGAASSDPWHGEWTADVGMPVGAKVAVGGGFRREFQHGTVLINTSAAAPQTFALGDPHLLPDGSVVTSVTLAPTNGLVLRAAAVTSTSPPQPAASLPASLAPPSISGTPQAGRTLVGGQGTWAGVPAAYAYQWLRCDRSGNRCSPLAGAVGRTYEPNGRDVGATLRLTVTASNGAGSASATTAATARVSRAPRASGRQLAARRPAARAGR